MNRRVLIFRWQNCKNIFEFISSNSIGMRISIKKIPEMAAYKGWNNNFAGLKKKSHFRVSIPILILKKNSILWNNTYSEKCEKLFRFE